MARVVLFSHFRSLGLLQITLTFLEPVATLRRFSFGHGRGARKRVDAQEVFKAQTWN